MKRLATALTILLLASPPALARNIDELESAGFSIMRATSVDGDFFGCAQRGGIHLRDGSSFYCQEPGKHYAHAPSAIVLRNDVTNEYALLIDGHEYQGVLRMGRGRGGLYPTDASPEPVFPPDPQAEQPLNPIASSQETDSNSQSIAIGTSNIRMDRSRDRLPTTENLLPDIERIASSPIRPEDQGETDTSKETQ